MSIEYFQIFHKYFPSIIRLNMQMTVVNNRYYKAYAHLQVFISFHIFLFCSPVLIICFDYLFAWQIKCE